jgi:hypothetical protein
MKGDIMSKRLILLTHGIGNTTEEFYKEWEKVLAKNHDLTDVTVKGLWWEDVLQKVADKYDIVSGTLAEIVAMCGFPDLQKWVGNDSWKEFKDYMMDVLVYVGLPDMWLMIQDECALKLEALRKDEDGNEVFDESDTILVGHSLGAAMLPHLVWREYAFTGAIPYRGMILLASPLGFESPNPQICKDFLQRMGEIFGGDRVSTLARFARAWNKGGEKRLRFISNENDIVCSDVKYKIPVTGQLVDLIPLRQGFNPSEISMLNSEHEGCVEFISFGERNPAKIGGNHDALTYLKQKSFNEALRAML